MFRRWLKEIHWPLAFSVAGLIVIGTLFVYSAAYHDSGNYLTKQFFWMAVALLVFMIMPFVGYRTLLSVSYLLYVIAIILLAGVLVAGRARLGAQRWITL